ncbi:MAG TPA: hypothetical protein PLK28_11485 [Candidatus Rifleibacterium sp.]|jgi:hypothetical protein|nr:hypothetical protein [Candidatus Rifleibacterium sp.]
MMTLYSIVATPDYAELLTLTMVILVCVGYISFLYGNAQRLGNDLSGFETTLVYLLGTLVFVSGTTIFGKLFFPANAESLLNLLYLKEPLNSLTQHFQIFLLTVLKMLM